MILTPKLREWIAIACVCVICAAGWLAIHNGKPGLWAVVTVDGIETARLPLNMDARLELPFNTIIIENGQARMQSADCPDGDCVRQGGAGIAGRTIVCLPNRVVITIDGDKPSGVDAESY